MGYNTHFITSRAYEHFHVYLTPFCKLQSDKKMRTKLQSVSDVAVREGNQLMALRPASQLWLTFQNLLSLC